MRSLAVDIDGPVHLADFGGTGRPIVLVHGIDGSHANFAAVGDAFAEHGRTLAVDLIGYGYTPPAGRTSDLRANRRLLVRLLRDRLGEPAVLVGTSMGGLLTMLTAAAAPDAVDRMVLIGPGQPRPRGVPLNWPLALAYLSLAVPGLGPVLARSRYRGDPVTRARAGLATVAHDPARIPDAAREAYLRMACERAEMAWAADAFLQSARSLVRELRRTEGFRGFVRRLRPPTLVVQGGADRLVSPHATRELVAIRDDWVHVELDGVGHSPQIEVPEQLVAIVTGWLRDGAGSAVAAGGQRRRTSGTMNQDTSSIAASALDDQMPAGGP